MTRHATTGTRPVDPARLTMPEHTCGSVTIIIRDLRAGDGEKATPLWGRYFERLTHHAARYLPAASVEDEDAALSAMNDFCNGLAEGKFDYVDRREVLWATLARITERKALRLGQGRWMTRVVLTDWQPVVSSDGEGRTRCAVVEPTETYRDAVRLELDELIDALENSLWRQAVRMVLEGYSVPEIAAKLERTRECVYVWFRTIRAIWREKFGEENPPG
jgi:ECF sigma factor/Homeodomain-like domain